MTVPRPNLRRGLKGVLLSNFLATHAWGHNRSALGGSRMEDRCVRGRQTSNVDLTRLCLDIGELEAWS